MFVCCVCFQVEVSGTNWSLVQRSHTDCGASCVWSRNLVNEEALAHWGGAVAPKTKTKMYIKCKTDRFAIYIDCLRRVLLIWLQNQEASGLKLHLTACYQWRNSVEGRNAEFNPYIQIYDSQ